MTQKGKEGKSENAIGRITALRWEPTHVTKHTSRSIPLQGPELNHLQGNSCIFNIITIVANSTTEEIVNE